MILGIGIDLVETERIQRAIERHGDRFTGRIFTRSEREYFLRKSLPFESFAARFSAKEAACKALGLGWPECRFVSIEVSAGDGGKPEIVFHGAALAAARERGVKKAFLSMTHDGGVSAAVVVLEG
jgi:holo-[acyl-carrier protein] synthase